MPPSEPPTLDWTQLKGHHELDRVPDFSYSGYKHNQVPVPTPPVLEVLSPSNPQQDRTRDIQDAIDRIGRSGQSGAVFLQAGSYSLNSSESIKINHFGIVLRGESPDSTFLRITGGKRRPVVVIGAGLDAPTDYQYHSSSQIVDPYVPVGASSLTVNDSSSFRVNDICVISRQVGEAWIRAMGMDKLERNGKHQTFLSPSTNIKQFRRITKIEQNINKIHFDIPLVESVDTKLCRASAHIVGPPPNFKVAQDCGIENLHIILNPSQSSLPLSLNPAFIGLLFSSFIQDCWTSRVNITGFNRPVLINPQAIRITLSNVIIHRNSPTDTSTKALPFDFELLGNFILLFRCRLIGNSDTQSHAVVTQARVMGPNAVVDFHTNQNNHVLATHHRWACGLLLDNCRAGKIQLTNRNTAGSGHGWSAGNCVAWNCVCSHSITVSKPPLAQNYFVGSRGKMTAAFGTESDGARSYQNHPVIPPSLFRDQLAKRIGPQTVDSVLPH